MKFYVGWDSDHPESSEVCAKSIAKFVGWDSVSFVNTPTLRLLGHYTRVHDGSESTDFTYTRFMVPYLSGYEGYSMFCDGDFLWRKDPRMILEYLNKDPVRVVKHNITPDMLTPTKMEGKPQRWYPMKNWSSLMLFNNSHKDCKKLNPHSVSTASPSWLHGFEWTDVNKTEELPREYNHLVGYYQDPDPVAVHFTDGGPWLKRYRTVEYAKEWFNVQREIKQTVGEEAKSRSRW